MTSENYFCMDKVCEHILVDKILLTNHFFENRIEKYMYFPQ